MLSAEELRFDLGLYAFAWLNQRRLVTRDLSRVVEKYPSPDAVHDLRVSCRRMREAIAFFSGAKGVGGLREIDRCLRRLMRVIGDLRQLDIGHKVCGRLGEGVISDAALELRAELRGALRRKRERRAERLKGDVSRRTKRLRRAMQVWSEHHMNGQFIEVDSSARDELFVFLETRLQQRRSEVLALCAGYANARDEGKELDDALSIRLHRIRIAIKHWRYALELTRSALPRDRPTVTMLVQLQSSGGASQDLYDIARWLGRRAERGNKRIASPLHELLQCARRERRDADRRFVDQLIFHGLMSPNPACSSFPPQAE